MSRDVPSLVAFKQTLERCATCPKLCRDRCPVAELEARETVTPWGLVNALHLESRGLAEGPGDAVYHCTTCMACQNFCHFSNEVPSLVLAARELRYLTLQAPTAVSQAAARALELGGNLYRKGVLQELSSRVSPARLDQRADELILVDSTTVVRYPEVISQLQELLSQWGFSNVSFFIHDELADAGYALYAAGDANGLLEHARRFAHALGRPRRLWVLRPGEAHLLKVVYPKIGVSVHSRVVTVYEALSERAPERRPSSCREGEFVLHTSCHLARSLGGADLAAALLERATGRKPREPLRHGEETVCCGGGGGMPMFHPDVARGLAAQCAERLCLHRGEIVVTTCAGCRRQLERVLENPIKDLVTVLFEAL